jgi:hypothetical protein
MRGHFRIMYVQQMHIRTPRAIPALEDFANGPSLAFVQAGPTGVVCRADILLEQP